MKQKFFIGFLLSFGFVLNAFSMSMTIKKEPAIVLAAFGTTTQARVTFDFIDQQVKQETSLKNLKIVWAFTSEIVRERANKTFRKKGEKTRYLSLLQVLANLEAEGYRKVVVQPLHVFPGQEFNEVTNVVNAFRMMGLRIELGETLLHEWPYVYETIDILSTEYLEPDKGCNIIVAHGTPKTFPGSNSTYLGLDRYVRMKYENVFVGAVDGVLTREQTLLKTKTCSSKRVRFIPFMLVAGDHIMNDIMGTEPDDEGVVSWSTELQQTGFKVDTLYARHNGQKLYKGLGFNKKIVGIYTHHIKNSLDKLESY